PGSWSGSPAPTFAYQWQECNSGGGGCQPISGATNAGYTVTAADVGFTLEALVTAANSSSEDRRAGPAGAVVPAPSSAPASVVAPSLTGTAAVGQTLTVSPGSWSGSPAPTFAYQWQECNSGGGGGQPISGATNAGYTVTAADVGFTLEALVTAANSAGSAAAATPASAVVPAPSSAPASVVAPSLTGTAAVGQTLTVSPGSWSGSPAPTFAYQWQECNSDGGGCQPISGATNAGYTVTAADVGFTLEALVTAANSAGSAAAATPASAVVPAPSSAPASVVAPSLTGTAAVGQTLTVSPGSWSGSPAPTFAYQWQECNSGGGGCQPISGATNAGYTVTAADVGFTL